MYSRVHESGFEAQKRDSDGDHVDRGAGGVVYSARGDTQPAGRRKVPSGQAGQSGAGQRFLKQYSEFGLKLPVLGMVTTTEESSLKSMGDEALGVITAGTYSAAIDTPTNRTWVQAMRAEERGASQGGAESGASDPVEAIISAKVRALRQPAGEGSRSCPTCGPRPEPDAVFCSTCGNRLPTGAICTSCGAALAPGARFCEGCGSKQALSA